MNIAQFKAGKFKKGYQYTYFLPFKINHSFYWTDEALNALLEKASIKLGELSSFSRLVPDIDLLIKMHVYKEAVLSSKIEGTRTNIQEALIDEENITPEKRDDWIEVNNYVSAMNYAIAAPKKLPLSNRLIRKTHSVLLSKGRGQYKNPGNFHKSQNWIGGTTLSDAIFVPPHHNELPDLLTDFEYFINNREIKIPHLIRIAIAHYQFETIHPFLDGNGRIGRLLITLYLAANKVLEKPVLYLSDFFEQHRNLYYDNLNLVRTQNNLAQWIKFFLTGVIETATQNVQTLTNVTAFKARLEKEVIVTMGKRAKQAHNFLQQLFTKPVITVKDAENMSGLSPKAAGELVKAFEKKKILEEITGFRRNRMFLFKEYIQCFKTERF